MAENTGNFVSKFAPQSYFFTAPGAISQSADQAFGPVSENQFRLTGKFTVSGSSMAYAICTGIVCIQPQSGDENKVNLILRPFKQPIQGVNIKYFIYRGLSKADFFNGDNVIAPTGTTSGFINQVNANFAAFYNSVFPGQTIPAFLAKYIGFDLANQADTLMLDSLFFKLTGYTDNSGTPTENTDNAFELPLVQQGLSLGNFAGGECGMDVVLSYGDYELPQPNDEFVFDLAYARAAEKIIDITAETDAFKKKQLKEQIFQFLDVAAYYGFHSNDQGWVKVKNAAADDTKKGEQIYTDLLQGFYTKNNIYLYVQSDRTRSYNFYGNYLIDESGDSSLKIGVTDTVLTAQAYTTNGWPLIVDNSTQNHSETRNKLYLQLVTDNNVNTMFYGQVAVIENAQNNNFCGADDLQLPPDENGNISTFVKVIQLSNPATGPSGAKLNIAGFNILIYQGQTYDYVVGQVTDANNVTTDIIAEPDFFDDVFGNLDTTALLKAGDSSFTTVASQKVKLVNHYFNNTQYGISAVQTSIVNDQIATGDDSNPTLARVTYITESIDTLSNAVAIGGTISTDTKSSPSIAGATTSSKTYSLPEPFYYDLTTFTDGTQTITGLQLKTTDGTKPNKIILGIAKAENDLLIALITANGFINARLFLIDLFEDGTQLISTENIYYQKYKASIVGEDTFGSLKLALPVTDIVVYSIDRLYHYTKIYSDYAIHDSLTDYILDQYINLDLAE